MEILKCQGLSKIYGTGENQVIALDHIDLIIEKGTFVTLVGASGSGKSTLLHILGSLDRPTEGSIIINDIDLSSLSRTEAACLRRREVGIVYQFYNLIPTLTVRQNILLPLSLDRRPLEKDFFNKVVETLNLTKRLDFMPHQLSGGQQQRTAIARALLYRPTILLADEPTGNLDKKNSEEIMNFLKRSNHDFQQTILVATHDDNIALNSDRTITLEDGRIIRDQKRR